MKKTWILGGIAMGCLAGASLGACGSSNATTTSSSGAGAASAASSGTTHTSSSAVTTSGATSSSAASSGGGSSTVSSTSGASTSGSTSASTSGSGSSSSGDAGATTTIAMARMNGVTTPITVAAVVTAIQGPSGDEVNYYIEDPAGGVYSGIDVYCDPAMGVGTCPAGPKAANPSLGDYLLVTGSISSYYGKAEFEPTAVTLISANHALPDAMPVTGADVAAANTSAQYRGVLVKLSETLTLTNLTPATLYDTKCSVDGGMTLCNNGCAPPTYAGFQTSDTGSSVIYVEQYLFPGDPLQSSPECMANVTQGETFGFMEGILELDTHATVQFLAPRTAADYSILDGGM